MFTLKTSRANRAIALALVALLALPAWAVTPSFPQLPEPGKAGMSKPDQEKLGLKAMAEVYKQMPVLPDSSPVTQYVQQLGEKLVKQIPQQYSWPYQFHVVKEKDINAFALPGGPIFINIGTIEAAQDEAQLAGVMSHEMSHVYMQHSAKQATSTSNRVLEILGAAAGMLGGSAVGDLARMGIQFGAGTLLLRYSRGDEAQADAVGAIIMYKAGYNPVELANFFEILSKQGGNPPQFLSDHPNPGNRTAAIEKEVRNWPPKHYLGNTDAFIAAKKDANGIKAYTAQEIADGAKQGRWARENMQAGAVPASAQAEVSGAASTPNLSALNFDQVKPSSEFTEVQQSGISIAHPANWGVFLGQNSLTIAPKAGVGQNAVAYGVIVSNFQDQNAGSLDQATQDLVQNLQQSNPGLRQDGSIRSVQVSGMSAREIDLGGSSPIQQNGSPLPERDRLVVTQQPSGGLLSLIFIAPRRDFEALQPTFQRMLESVRLQ